MLEPRHQAPIAVLALFLLGQAQVAAHGGAYRGPVPKVPTTVSTPRAGGGTAPTRGSPGTPGGAKPTLLPYDAAWFVWWEYNKDRYVRPPERKAPEKAAQGGTRVEPRSGLLRRGYVEQTVIPALVRILERHKGSRELITGSLIALARLRPRDEVVPIITSYLKEGQEYAETAALALGITGCKSAFPVLLKLANNERKAARLVRGDRVGYRTRSFALFGLGVWCQRSSDNYNKSKVLAALTRILGTEAKSKRRNLRMDTEVAALQALRLLVTDNDRTSDEILRRDAMEFLLRYIKEKKRNEALFHAHAITALGGVLGHNEDPGSRVRTLLLGILNDRTAPGWVQQSAVMSLGRTGKETEPLLVEQLERFMKKGKDRHARSLAAIALGRIASDKAREVLLKNLGGRDSTWVALGLAVLDFERRLRHGDTEIDKTIGNALHGLAGRRLAPTQQNAAYAIALGVQRYRPAAEKIAKGIDVKQENLWNGYLAESLGLLGVKSSYKKLKKLADKSAKHPAVLTKASTALGRIGDPKVAAFLLKLLRTRKDAIEHAAIAQALSEVGGEREAGRLLRLVKDPNQKDVVRGFAAVALGIMGEPDLLPWHYQLVSGCNYLAQTETLVGGGKGVLEIL